jgi:hypothetical protein
MNKTKLILGLAATCLAGNMAFANLLVDRGLPTANLNDAAGALRSNVAWVDGGYTAGNYVMEGDTFQNTSAQTWSVNTIRLWTVGTTTTAVLWGGLSTETPGVVSGPVTYTGGVTYQGSSGTPWLMNQVDFTVNITLLPGQIYDFFLDGTGGNYTIPFLHASNAALSGSPQQGADDLMLNATVIGGSINSISPWTSDSSVPGLNNGGWDKPSDINVQVFGSSVPDGGMTVVLLGGALMGLAALRRKLAC